MSDFPLYKLYESSLEQFIGNGDRLVITKEYVVVLYTHKDKEEKKAKLTLLDNIRKECEVRTFYTTLFRDGMSAYMIAIKDIPNQPFLLERFINFTQEEK